MSKKNPMRKSMKMTAANGVHSYFDVMSYDIDGKNIVVFIDNYVGQSVVNAAERVMYNWTRSFPEPDIVILYMAGKKQCIGMDDISLIDRDEDWTLIDDYDWSSFTKSEWEWAVPNWKYINREGVEKMLGQPFPASFNLDRPDIAAMRNGSNLAFDVHIEAMDQITKATSEDAFQSALRTLQGAMNRDQSRYEGIGIIDTPEE